MRRNKLRVFAASAHAAGRWPCLSFDPAARRVYISRGTEIQVLNADNDSVVGNITGLKRDHGVAVVPEFGRGFITDGEAGHGPAAPPSVHRQPQSQNGGDD